MILLRSRAVLLEKIEKKKKDDLSATEMALRARSRQEASFLISTVDRSGPAKHINFLSWGGGGWVGLKHTSREKPMASIYILLHSNKPRLCKNETFAHCEPVNDR